MKTKEAKQTRQLFFISVGILFILIALSVWNVANAQPPAGGGQRGPHIPSSKQIKKMVAEVSKELSLSDEQESKVSELYVAHFDEVKKAASSGRPERGTMEALETKFEQQVDTVLSTEQQKLFAAYQKKNRKPQRQGPNG